jgi:hypothetical protein
MFRRLVVFVAVIGLLGVAVPRAFGAPVAAATSAAGCTLSGTASISPGLTTKAQPVSFSFGGKITCAGTIKGTGSLSGSGFCPSASVLHCSPSASVSFTTSLGITCASGKLNTLTGLVTVTCSTNKGPITAVVLFVPSPLTKMPVTNVTFNGTAVLG